MNSDDLELISQLRTIAHEVEALEERIAELEAVEQRVKALSHHWRTDRDLQRPIFDALADALDAALKGGE